MGIANNRIDFIYKIATGSRKMRNLLTPVGALFFFSILALIISAALWLDRLLDLPRFMPEPYRSVFGIPILAIGLFMMFWSVFHFVRARGTPVPFNPPPELVTTGPYAYVRNPMMSGLFVAMFGLAIILGSISLAFIFTPAFILLNVYAIRRIEEPELERRLGAPYIEYKSRVPRFWPRVPKGGNSDKGKSQ